MTVLTKMGKCVVCRRKVKQQREFQPQLRLGEQVPAGIPSEMAQRIVDWRDKPLLCDTDAVLYEVRRVKSRA